MNLNGFSVLDRMSLPNCWCKGAPYLLLFWAASVAAGESGCLALPHGFGPFDYRNPRPDQIRMVEGAHFFANVENLREGTVHPNRGYIVLPGDEIDYTLRAYPNHHRALLAASRLAIRDKTERPKGFKTTIDCYFKLAMEFKADDSMVPLIYGIHLSKTGRMEQAIEYFDRAKALGDDSANLHYNLGLAYFQAKRYPEALESAHKAYAAGFPLAGLKNMLVLSGQWKDPVPVPPSDEMAGKNKPAAVTAPDPTAEK